MALEPEWNPGRNRETMLIRLARDLNSRMIAIRMRLTFLTNKLSIAYSHVIPVTTATTEATTMRIMFMHVRLLKANIFVVLVVVASILILN